MPLTIACLSLAVFLGLGTGAVFKLVPEWFPDSVGAVTGVVGAAGGLGGFFPPLVMALVKGVTGAYTLGFVLLAVVAIIALVVLRAQGRTRGAGADGRRRPSVLRYEPGPRSPARPSVLRTARPLRGRLERGLDLRSRLGGCLSTPLAARSRRSLHPRRQLHRLVLVEDPRQGRPRHLGDPADRLSLQRSRHARLRAARVPARSVVLLVPLLAAAPQASLRARRAARDVPRRAAAPRRPGRGLGIDRRRSRACSRLQIAARQGRLRPRLLGGRRRADRRRPRAHRHAATGRTGSPASRRSPRCRWSPTRPAPASSR